MQNDQISTGARFERMGAVVARTGLSRSTIYRLVNANDFPRPIRITPQSSAWLSTDVDGWVADRVATARATGK